MRISLNEWAARHHSQATMPSLATLRCNGINGLCYRFAGEN